MWQERVVVYIDGSNLFHSLRDTCGRIDLDFRNFALKLAENNRLVRTYYYTAMLDQSKEPENYRSQQRFLEKLKKVNYLELRYGRLVYNRASPPTASQKGVDVKLATDMLVHGGKGMFDKAILVSGDTDFADALQALKHMGLHTEVALFDRTGSRLLRQVADSVIEFDAEFLQRCWEK